MVGQITTKLFTYNEGQEFFMIGSCKGHFLNEDPF